MKIKVKVKTKFIVGNDLCPSQLVIYVKIKKPNRIFPVRMSRVLIEYKLSKFWYEKYSEYGTYEEFLLDCYNILSDKQYLKEVAKNMVCKHFEVDKTIKKIKTIKELTKNKFQIDVDIPL